ncbi:MAG TPA: DUF167 domain-containing protein [Paracoccus sp. (in: a-proteobacteria)]|nr:DUF167 domain-containing protein [Paracoccus sp. (in: a-proteobacteria)]
MDRIADLRAQAQPGARLAVRVTPRGGRDELTVGPDGTIRIRVTAAPEDGRANEAARKLLARALGVAKSRLTLVGGATARDKLFRLD